MQINASLDVDVVAHETEDEVSVLLQIQAPPPPVDRQRPQASLQVVLDCSGSMAGPRLEGAKRALVDLVHRLDPSDNFGLVAFNGSSYVVVPAGPLTDKQRVVQLIEGVFAGGSTDLSSGYLRGLREVRRVATAGATLLVVSDGHVNSGLTDPDEFAGLAAKAYADGVVTSTLGYGDGYDEVVLSTLARAGSGNHVFAADPDAAIGAIAGEVDGLLAKSAQAVSLTVRFEPEAEFVRLFNDLPAQQVADGTVVVELGDMFAGEERKVLLKLKVPALSALGLTRVADLELEYVETADLIERVVGFPINVNVVPGDEAASRVPDPTVRSEELFLEAQETKRQASEALLAGDLEGGRRRLRESSTILATTRLMAPREMQAEIDAQIGELSAMEESVERHDVSTASKRARESYLRTSRRRSQPRRRESRRLSDEGS